MFFNDFLKIHGMKSELSLSIPGYNVSFIITSLAVAAMPFVGVTN